MSGIGNGYENYTNGGGNNNAYVTGYNGTKGLHSDGANYLAADGHVKWLRPTAVSYGYVALNASNPQTTTAGAGAAAGTNNSTFSLTFSPI